MREKTSAMAVLFEILTESLDSAAGSHKSSPGSSTTKRNGRFVKMHLKTIDRMMENSTVFKSCQIPRTMRPESSAGGHAAGAHHLGQVTAGHHGRWLVVDAALEAGGAPVHELDGALGLDGGHGSVHILWDHVATSESASAEQKRLRSDARFFVATLGARRYIMQQAMYLPGALFSALRLKF